MQNLKIAPHEGENYVLVLHHIHATLRPATYLEIGTQSGQSLDMSKCATIAIDPSFQIGSNVFGGKPVCHLYQMSSDQFFKHNDPTAIFGAEIDLAFLDGLHLSEFLLRDFINVEKHCRRNSIIAIHDCLPLDVFSARRSANDQVGSEESDHPDWWAGDVWKVIHILKKHRPDLKILALDAPPTGLVLVTNLDNTSRLLEQNYYNMLEDARSWDLKEIGLDNYMKSLDVQPTTVLTAEGDRFSPFWL